MSAIYPGARWEPVAYTGLHARHPYRAALLHTNGSTGSDLKGWWDSCASGRQGTSNLHLGAHYQVLQDGTAFAYVDPALVVYHAFSASEWALGIETQDGGAPNTTPWTAAQIETIAQILHFHGVPARMLTSSSPGDGVGYHQQQTAWNGSGHNCPGPLRVSQIPTVLARLAALYAPTPAPVRKPPTPPAPVFPEDEMFTFIYSGGVYLVVSGKVIAIEDIKYVPAGCPSMGTLSDRQHDLLLQGLGLTAA